MSEQEASHEELEAFREEIERAIDATIFIITSEQDAGSFTIDPFSLGLGDETLAELPVEKQRVVKAVLYDLSGITDSEYQCMDTYRTGENGDISVRLVEGVNVDEEGNVNTFYVHELQHADGQLDWQISTSMDRIKIT